MSCILARIFTQNIFIVYHVYYTYILIGVSTQYSERLYYVDLSWKSLLDDRHDEIKVLTSLYCVNKTIYLHQTNADITSVDS
jgi:hypothetical protein